MVANRRILLPIITHRSFSLLQRGWNGRSLHRQNQTALDGLAVGGGLANGTDVGRSTLGPQRLDVRRGLPSHLLPQETMEELRTQETLGQIEKIQRNEFLVCHSTAT